MNADRTTALGRIAACGLLLAMTVIAAPPEGDVPILSVCEVLNNLAKYRGQKVIVIGSIGFTFEGNMISEKCGKCEIRIGRSKWPSIIADLGERAGAPAAKVPADRAVLMKKLRTLNDGPARPKRQRPPGISLESSSYAVFGVIASPNRLARPVPGVKAGNGYGANGSVAAGIIVLARFSLEEE